MSEETVLDITFRTLWIAIQIASPALIAALVIGLVVSIIQAATQINEQTLSFIPKILAMLAAMIITGPWVIEKMMDFTIHLFKEISTINH